MAEGDSSASCASIVNELSGLIDGLRAGLGAVGDCAGQRCSPAPAALPAARRVEWFDLTDDDDDAYDFYVGQSVRKPALQLEQMQCSDLAADPAFTEEVADLLECFLAGRAVQLCSAPASSVVGPRGVAPVEDQDFDKELVDGPAYLRDELPQIPSWPTFGCEEDGSPAGGSPIAAVELSPVPEVGPELAPASKTGHAACGSTPGRVGAEVTPQQAADGRSGGASGDHVPSGTALARSKRQRKRAAVAARRANVPICGYFQADRCFFGSRCRFRHVALDGQEAPDTIDNVKAQISDKDGIPPAQPAASQADAGVAAQVREDDAHEDAPMATALQTLMVKHFVRGLTHEQAISLSDSLGLAAFSEESLVLALIRDAASSDGPLV